MKRCPVCGEGFGSKMKFCPTDGTPLHDPDAHDDVRVGTVLAGRYHLLERLGAGAFGTVYRATDMRLEDVEAVKVFDRRRLPPEHAAEAMERFSREAKLLRQLGKRSRHIVGVTNFVHSEEEDLFFFAMEYVPGENLAQILIREGPLELPRALDLMRQLCDALRVAHSNDPPVVHRDLKLENLMVTRVAGDEVLKVLDFGIAKVVGRGSLTDLSVGGPGTPGYAAPEQVRRPDQIDGRADLFALGVVMFSILTGREPWTGRIATEPVTDPWGLLKASMEGEPLTLGSVRSDLPPALEAVIAGLLQKEPEDRFASADDLLEALEAVVRPAAGLPGTLRVDSSAKGIRILVLDGREVVAEARSPWAAGALSPGSYRVEVDDPRYAPEAHDVEVRSGQEARVLLAGEYVGRSRTPILAAVAVLVMSGAALAWWFLAPGPSMTVATLMGRVSDGGVASVRLVGDELRVDLGDARGVVPLGGQSLQRLMARLEAEGVPVEAPGESSVRVAPVDDAGGPVSASVLTLVSERGPLCDPCDAPLEATPGWYTLRVDEPGWRLDSIRVRTPGGGFAIETLRPEDGRVFLPPGDFEMTALVSRGSFEDPRLAELPDEAAAGSPELTEEDQDSLEEARLARQRARQDSIDEAERRALAQARQDSIDAANRRAARVQDSLDEVRQDSIRRAETTETEPVLSAEEARRQDSIARAREAPERRPTPPRGSGPVATVRIEGDVSPLTEGETRAFAVEARNADGDVVGFPRATLWWISSDAAVLSLTEDREILAEGPGNAWLIARVGEAQDSVELRVVMRVTSITIRDARRNVLVGETLRPTAWDQADRTLVSDVVWSSSDEAVLRVDADRGVATAVAPGTALLIARRGQVSDTVSITVSAGD